MMHRSRLWLALASVPLLSLGTLSLTSSCEVTPDTGDADRQQVLRDLVANVMVATWSDLTAATATLRTATSALRANPSAQTLTAAQDAYRAARSLYKQSEAFYFGPVDDLLLTGGTIDRWPADGAAIDALVAGMGALDASAITRLGANQRGFPALEHLLFDSAVSQDEVLARFQQPNTGARRGELAESVATELAQKCSAVLAAWTAPNGYAHELAEAGVDSRMFHTQSEGLDKIVTALVALTEQMMTLKLEKPLGLDSDGAPHPEREESARSDSSLNDLRDNLLGVQAIYSGQRNGHAGKGLADPVRARNPDAATRFEQALAQAQAAVAAVPPPFRLALLQNRASLAAAHEALNEVERALKTEIAGALGASIGFGFSDTD